MKAMKTDMGALTCVIIRAT